MSRSQNVIAQFTINDSEWFLDAPERFIGDSEWFLDAPERFIDDSE